MHHAHRIAESFRRELAATVLVGEIPVRTKYVIEPTTGHLVLNVDPELLGSNDDVVLHAPDEHEDALHARIGFLGALDARTDGACDRWMAYHLRMHGPGFARCEVLSARLGTDRESIVDGSDLELINALARDESRLCRNMNADRSRLRVLLDASAIDPGDDEPPTLVGVDHGGIHLRAAFGVRRIGFEQNAPTSAQAESEIESLVARAAGGRERA